MMLLPGRVPATPTVSLLAQQPAVTGRHGAHEIVRVKTSASSWWTR